MRAGGHERCVRDVCVRLLASTNTMERAAGLQPPGGPRAFPRTCSVRPRALQVPCRRGGGAKGHGQLGKWQTCTQPRLFASTARPTSLVERA